MPFTVVELFKTYQGKFNKLIPDMEVINISFYRFYEGCKESD